MDTSDLKELAKRVPSSKDLIQEWQLCVDRHDERSVTRERLNVNSRVCWWKGQSEDGRKYYRRSYEEKVFPWLGAADSRVHLTDTFVNEDVALLNQSLRRAILTLQAQPTEITDSADAGAATTLLRWQLINQITELDSEAKLAANYFLERGKVVIGTIWCQERQKGYDRVTLETISEIVLAAQTAMRNQTGSIVAGIPNEDLAQLDAIINDPTREEAALEIGQKIWSDASTNALKNLLKALRTQGEGRIPRVYLKRNRPTISALILGQDVFLPPDATGINDELRSLHWRTMVSETTLKDRVNTHGWTKEWVEQLIEKGRGKVSTGTSGIKLTRNAKSGTNALQEDQSQLFEVIHSYRRLHDEEGVPGIYCTTWAPTLLNNRRSGDDEAYFADHTLVEYDHGEYPFTLIQRERRDRNPYEARGYGEVADTWQQGMKSEWDSRRDRNALATVPPSYHPTTAPPHQWGPGVQVGTGRPDAYGFFKGPGWDPGSKEMEKTILSHADRYFGRLNEEHTNALGATNIPQDLVDTWLKGWTDVITQVFQLDQQFMSEAVYARVLGTERSKPLKVTRDMIQGKYNLVLVCSVRNMDPEFLDRKIKVVGEAMRIDKDASINTTEVIRSLFEAVDVNLPERVLRNAQDSMQAELKDEESAWAKMSAGIPVDVEIGQNYQLRLQWLENMVKTNPEAQRKLQNDQGFQQLVMRRYKQLSHQIEQFGVNAQIGRLGA